MKLKDIVVGQNYKLKSKNKSRVGCARTYFNRFLNNQITVLKKLNNFYNRNTVYIQGFEQREDGPKLINFWCSPYDLKELSND
jgi:hypothetical protein